MDKFVKMSRVTSADKKTMNRSYPISGKRGQSVVVSSTKAQFVMGSNTFLHKRNGKQIYHVYVMVGPNSGKRKLIKYETAIGVAERNRMMTSLTKMAKKFAKDGGPTSKMKGSYFAK